MLVTFIRDAKNSPAWLLNSYVNEDELILRIDEPPVEKENSYKARATVMIHMREDRQIRSCGEVIIYFSKEEISNPQYGSLLYVAKQLQPIRNSGNPGAFNYARYCAANNISHQVFLSSSDYIPLEATNTKQIQSLIFNFRQHILSSLARHIPGQTELGLAEALLIGYKNDLEDDLVRAYSNTGVVHVIAISGLHLGLIYWLLVRFFRSLRHRHLKWLSPILIIFILWFFSFAAGGQASVLRSAMMFTCIVVAENISRKTNIFNTLAFSAFILLCYDPFWLWDAGFQLSYAAVLSILVFMRPIYNIIYVENKLLDNIWKLCAVTLAAQLLTLPIILYHFDQFPVYFLITNLIAVPMSSMILMLTILLCLSPGISGVASALGDITTWSIRAMNRFILNADKLPFATWDNIQVTVAQSICITAIIIFFSMYLIHKQKTTMYVSLAALFFLCMFRTSSFYETNGRRLIVYNIPKSTAVDLMDGHQFMHIAKPMHEKNSKPYLFHIRPTRTLLRSYYLSKTISATDMLIRFDDITLGICEKKKMLNKTDLLMICGSLMPDTTWIKQTRPRIVILSSSLSNKSTNVWKMFCTTFKITYHDVKERAFVMNVTDSTFARR